MSYDEEQSVFGQTTWFVTSRNYVTKLIICIEIWTEMMGKGHPIDIIYTDFAKAFDRVPHQRLSRKIRSNGIIG